MWRREFIPFLLFILQSVSGQNSPSFGLGLMVAEMAPADEVLFCVKYYPKLYNLPSERSKADVFKMADIDVLSDVDSCDSEDIPPLDGKFAILNLTNKVNNCSIATRAKLVQEHKGTGVLADVPLSSKFNETGDDITVAVAALYSSSDRDQILELKSSKPESKFFFYAPDDESIKNFDFSLVLIFCMAIFTVGVGSLWSGFTKQAMLEMLSQPENDCDQSGQGKSEDEEKICGHEGDGKSKSVEDASLRVSPFLVLCFVVIMCLMLVVLYFFFDKLVYVIISMFCLASTIAIYSCFEPLVMWSYEAVPGCPIWRLPRCNLYLCVLNMELRQFVLLAISVSITVVWFVFRKSDWSWILQDFIGVLFSINMLKTLRLPSFKICTLLLSTLFFYDIFFVFITPLFTKDGKSVMVEVATGGTTGEQLPIMLKVPHFSSGPMDACYSPYSMLGFGDMLVPGLLLSYCFAFDLQKGHRFWIYWVTTNIAYGLGLVATFVSLYVMNSAQPALLYLVPFTLVPVFVVAACRGDLVAMWKGDFENDQTPGDRQNNADVEVDEAEADNSGRN